MNQVTTATENAKQAKNVRHRKKSYFNSIRKQMEFYFGDANLSKDRFLMQLIKDDPFVPLDVFMNFNKIKKLTGNVDDIAKSLTNSQLLELNASATCVRRCTEIPVERNADDRTLYVESLPQNADHDWVIKAFSRFGPVAYVSLPKYQHSRKIKEFAFVEFERDDGTRNALKAFHAFNGVLCSDTTKPDELMSVTSYLKEKEQNGGEADRAVVAASAVPNGDAKSIESDQYETTTESDNDTDSAPDTKRAKYSDVETPPPPPAQPDVVAVKHPKKKKRKHRKKPAVIVTSKTTPNAQSKDSVPDVTDLKIIHKKDWKRLRNKYLNLQREKVGAIKRQIWLNRGPKSTRTTPRLPIHRSPHNMNFYQDLDKDTAAAAADTPEQNGGDGGTHLTALKNSLLAVPLQRDPLFHYESGLIVHVRLHESCVDVKSFKDEMRQYDQVKYVDVKEGAIEAHLRCDCVSNAQKLLQQIGCTEYKCTVLGGIREEAYWQKIMKDRDAKLNKTIVIKTKRGREKVKRQAAQHIRFDDDE